MVKTYPKEGNPPVKPKCGKCGHLKENHSPKTGACTMRKQEKGAPSCTCVMEVK